MGSFFECDGVAIIQHRGARMEGESQESSTESKSFVNDDWIKLFFS